MSNNTIEITAGIQEEIQIIIEDAEAHVAGGVAMVPAEDILQDLMDTGALDEEYPSTYVDGVLNEQYDDAMQRVVLAEIHRQITETIAKRG
jgi:hypothetical protein